MVKQLNIPLDDELYNSLISVKGKKTWAEFFREIIASKKVG